MDNQDIKYCACGKKLKTDYGIMCNSCNRITKELVIPKKELAMYRKEITQTVIDAFKLNLIYSDNFEDIYLRTKEDKNG